MKNLDHFRPENLREYWKEWLLPLCYGEFGCVIAYPGVDTSRRVLQLSQESNLIKKTLTLDRIKLKVADFRIERWQNVNAFRNWMKKGVNVIFLLGFETILMEKRVDLIKELQTLYREGVRILLFADNNIFDSEYEWGINHIPGWQPRVCYFRTYEHGDLRKFIQYLMSKWKISLDSVKIEAIIEKSGGILIFAKELVWEELANTRSSINLDWQVKGIWERLTKSDRDYLRRLVFGREVAHTLNITKSYFQQIGWVKDSVLLIPILCDYIKNNELDPVRLKIVSERITINGADYSRYFTELQRKILTKLIESKTIVSREEIMVAGWGQKEVSDWALDSQMKRLRDRLIELGIGEKHMITKRGKGIVWLS